jgi:HSP20 family molecular chaperone IbpA
MSTRLVNNMLDTFFNDDFFRPISSSFSRTATSYVPALNIQEFPESFEVSLSLPSIDPSLLKVEIEDKVLSISYQEEVKDSYENDADSENKVGNFIRREWQAFSSFRRSVVLSKEIDHQKPVEAEYDRGVLRIIIHKMPQTQPKSVNIKIKDTPKEN